MNIGMNKERKTDGNEKNQVIHCRRTYIIIQSGFFGIVGGEISMLPHRTSGCLRRRFLKDGDRFVPCSGL